MFKSRRYNVFVKNVEINYYKIYVCIHSYRGDSLAVFVVRIINWKTVAAGW